MNTIRWSQNVSYNPTAHTVIFLTNPKHGNEAMSLIEYYQELYPTKSWLDVATLAIPELARVEDKEDLKFYAMPER
ncbi:MAG: hypothetical protein N3A54_05570 [Patescibacteria group bacterium]|nr:hypothetical protein [Patescibacteria group bacterium]